MKPARVAEDDRAGGALGTHARGRRNAAFELAIRWVVIPLAPRPELTVGSAVGATADVLERSGGGVDVGEVGEHLDDVGIDVVPVPALRLDPVLILGRGRRVPHV